MSARNPSPSPKTLGILLGTAPSEPSHRYGIRLAQQAQQAQVQVYLYLLDDAVSAVDSELIRALGTQGVKITACAYAAERRRIELADHVTFGGLGLLNDIIQKPTDSLGFALSQDAYRNRNRSSYFSSPG